MVVRIAPYVLTVSAFTTAAVLADPDEVEGDVVDEVELPPEPHAAATRATTPRALRLRALRRGRLRHPLAGYIVFALRALLAMAMAVFPSFNQYDPRSVLRLALTA